MKPYDNRSQLPTAWLNEFIEDNNLTIPVVTRALADLLASPDTFYGFWAGQAAGAVFAEKMLEALVEFENALEEAEGLDPQVLAGRYGVQESWTEVDNGTVSEALSDVIGLAHEEYLRAGTSDRYQEWVDLIEVLIGVLRSSQN